MDSIVQIYDDLYVIILNQFKKLYLQLIWTYRFPICVVCSYQFL